MSAESEFPLPGEATFKYPDKLEQLGGLWDALKADAQTVDDIATPVKGSAAALQTGNYGLTAEASTRVVNTVSGHAGTAAKRLRWFERPINDYIGVLNSTRTPINTLRESWREGERDLKRLQDGEAIYVTDEFASYADKWAGRQTELRNAYTSIITTTIDPGKDAFVGALRAIAENREPPATQPISLPQLPTFPTLPGVYPRTGGPPPPVTDPDRGDDDDDGGPGDDPGPGTRPGGNDHPDPEPTDPPPTDPPPPTPTPTPTPKEVLEGWFGKHPVDGMAILAAWLVLPVGKPTFDSWLASPAGRTALATWIGRPRQDAAFTAWLATPAAGDDLATWLRDSSGLEPDQVPADPRAWIRDPANAEFRSRWLADPKTREDLATWIAAPENAARRDQWLADPKTQTPMVGWLGDSQHPENGKPFADWTQKTPNPADILPDDPPPPAVDPTNLPATTALPATTGTATTDTTNPGPAPGLTPEPVATTV